MLFLAAIAPSIALLFYFYIRDKYEKEPGPSLIRAFVLGCFTVLPAIALETRLNLFDVESRNIVAVGYTAFIVAGFVEELIKYLVFLRFVWRDRNFNEMYDGIIYCVYISLGFATIENVGYVMSSGFNTAFVRAVTAVPAHALFAVAMGYYLGVAKFVKRRRRAQFWILGLFVPVALHGVYDFILLSRRLYALVLFIPYMLYLWIRGLRNVDELVEASPFKHAELTEASDELSIIDVEHREDDGEE